MPFCLPVSTLNLVWYSLAHLDKNLGLLPGNVPPPFRRSSILLSLSISKEELPPSAYLEPAALLAPNFGHGLEMAATEEAESDTLTVATKDMCAKAFHTICTTLLPHLPAPPTLDFPTSEGGLFVTWSAPRGPRGNYSLRGCIGTLSRARLDAAVERYASYAAFSDSRFDPIAASEVDNLKVGVSVLSGFEKANHVYDWDIGTHGVILELAGGRYSATYLPEVCSDQSWSKEVCIRSLADKAGFRRPINDAVLETAVLTRYQSTKAELHFEEYLELIGEETED